MERPGGPGRRADPGRELEQPHLPSRLLDTAGSCSSTFRGLPNLTSGCGLLTGVKTEAPDTCSPAGPNQGGEGRRAARWEISPAGEEPLEGLPRRDPRTWEEWGDRCLCPTSPALGVGAPGRWGSGPRHQPSPDRAPGRPGLRALAGVSRAVSHSGQSGPPLIPPWGRRPGRHEAPPSPHRAGGLLERRGIEGEGRRLQTRGLG